MQLSPDLDALLCARYPVLFANRQADLNDSSMGWGFEIGPGWFALVDTLSSVLSADSRYRAVQVKSKHGRLRFDLNPGSRDSSIVGLVESLSMRVCEVSGRPGRLCRYKPLWLATLAPGVSFPNRDGLPETSCPVFDAERPEFYVPPIGFTLEEMMATRAGVLTGRVDVPAGWYELADTVLQQLQHDPGWPRIAQIWADDAELRIEWDGDGSELVGLSNMAATLSRRFDQVTGAMV